MRKYTDAVRLFKNWTLLKKGFLIFIVQEDFRWLIDYNNINYSIIVKKGFETNFWSIPKIIQNIFSPTKFLGYILHDFLYSWGEIIYSTPEKEIKWRPSRKESDEILREAIRVEWAKFIERWLIYIGVRIWWTSHYTKND